MKMHVVRSGIVVAMLSLVVSACGAGESGTKDELDLRLRLSDEATAADVGLPAYPGAKIYRDDDDSGSANLGLSTPLFGFKVVAIELETSDEPQRIAAFYRRALSKYGNVLDCSQPADENRVSQSDAARTDELECDANDPGIHSFVYKVGTEENQRVVAIQPHGSGARFSLVHVDIRAKSKQ